MEHFRRGRHKRLKKRFDAFDHQVNREVWVAFVILGLPTVLVVGVLRLIPNVPELLSIVLIAGTMLASFVANATWWYARKRSIARNLGLICSRCSQPLPYRLMETSGEYQHCFTVPSVCPHCNLSIHEATRRSKHVEK